MFEAEFPSLRERAYLDWAAVGIPPLRSVGAIRAALDQLESQPDYFASGSSQAKAKDEARQALSQVLGCDPGHVVFTGTSTTSAVQTAVDAVNPQKGDNVVILDMDFPLVYGEAYRLKVRGVEVRVVRNSDGDYELDSFYDVIDKRTRALVVSSVMWVNGLRLEVEELSKLVHEVEGYLLVDAIQEAGALRMRWLDKADFVAFGTQKWLLSPYGIGVLCVGKRAVEELSPPRPGYSNMKVSDWDSFWEDPTKVPLSLEPFDRYSPLKFEYGGSFSPLPFKGLSASMSLLSEVGMENVEATIMRLRKAMVEELDDVGADVLSPGEARKASGIVLFRLPGTPRYTYELVRRLRARGVAVSGRGAAGVWGIRASVHFPNKEDDVVALSSALRELRDQVT